MTKEAFYLTERKHSFSGRHSESTRLQQKCTMKGIHDGGQMLVKCKKCYGMASNMKKKSKG